MQKVHGFVSYWDQPKIDLASEKTPCTTVLLELLSRPIAIMAFHFRCLGSQGISYHSVVFPKGKHTLAGLNLIPPSMEIRNVTPLHTQTGN